jgi:stage II sporulation protein D
VRGDVLRVVINRKLGDRAMLSTRFSVTLDRAGWVFEGTGFGHGVGLCPRGAAARARRGDTVTDIIQAYFPGARLTQPRSTP